MSRSQASSKSRSSFRLYFFTFLSVIACALALANVASAATPSGEDQYLEQPPVGGGNSDTGEDSFQPVDSNNDGVISEAEVKAAAAKQKKKAKKKAKDAKEEGASGATGASGAAGTTPTPPAAESVATAAKIGPFSKNTALMLGALALLIGLGAFVFGSSGPGLFGIGGGSSSGTPPPAQ
ncbi:MAG: hypothetical protein JHC98_04960 [Thermoleophilaceae bacterium]|nr:hypothetical protein [Thermoleophilaceae bacterium]